MKGAPSGFCKYGMAFAMANMSNPSAMAAAARFVVACDLHPTRRHMKCAAKRRSDFIVFPMSFIMAGCWY